MEGFGDEIDAKIVLLSAMFQIYTWYHSHRAYTSVERLFGVAFLPSSTAARSWTSSWLNFAFKLPLQDWLVTLMRWVTVFFSKVLCTMIIRAHEIHTNCGKQLYLFLTVMANTTCFAPTWIHTPPIYDNLQNRRKQNSEENLVYLPTLTSTGQFLTPS